MFTHPTLDLLSDLGLHGMAKGFRDLADNPEGAALGHAEWLGILLERESTLRWKGGAKARRKSGVFRHANLSPKWMVETPKARAGLEKQANWFRVCPLNRQIRAFR